jgi:YD repeat-containing protein
LQNGGIYTFPSCPPELNKACTVSSYRDSDGNEIRMQHDGRMNLVRIESHHGSAIDLTHDNQDRIVLARSSDGQQVKYEYDAQGRLTRVRGADGRSARYGYDAGHQMVEIEEPGLSITNTYDSDGRCIVNGAGGRGPACRARDSRASCSYVDEPPAALKGCATL